MWTAGPRVPTKGGGIEAVRKWEDNRRDACSTPGDGVRARCPFYEPRIGTLPNADMGLVQLRQATKTGTETGRSESLPRLLITRVATAVT